MLRGGQLIKIARESRGMTQGDIADSWGVSLRTIQRWENYRNEPKFIEVIGIVTDICKLSLSEVEEMAFENNQRC